MHAKNLTKQLLTYTRGGASIKKPVSLEEIIREAANISLSGTNVRCESRFDDELLAVEADEGQLGRVFYTILNNTRRAMPDGGVIHISVENLVIGRETLLPLPEGNCVRVVVQDRGDRGIGAMKGMRAKTVGPCAIAKQEASDPWLAAAHSVIKNHNGHLIIEFELGIGALFTIYLPAADQEMENTNAEENGPVSSRSKVLLMDDEEMFRSVVGVMLNRIGYDVEFAGDGIEAINLYKRAKDSTRPFDVIIMDLLVPGGVGGQEAIRRLLEIDPHAKAIVSSGHSSNHVMTNFREYGFCEALAKPFRYAELGEILHIALAETRI